MGRACPTQSFVGNFVGHLCRKWLEGTQFPTKFPTKVTEFGFLGRALGTLLSLTAITALCMALPVCSGTSAYAKSTHAGGPGGGGSGGNSFYATVINVSQLIADINYANTVGGAITINLAPGTTF